VGHIFFITPSSPGSLDKLNQWTFRWLLEHGNMAEDSTLYTCNSIESAQSLLESALIIGQSPSLIIFDHADHATEKNLAFSKELHNGIPESWIIEIIPDDMPLPEDSRDDSTFWIRRPINEEEWYATLENVLHKNCSPQWAKWTQHKSFRGI
jgi:hypothetical protein